MAGFVDADAATWLDELVEVAVQEARERGRRLVEPEHLGLALTRDAQTAQLFDGLGIDPRRWRDYINFVLGVNEGMESARHERVPSGHLVAAGELYSEGEVALGSATRALVSHAFSEANGRAVGPASLLTAILVGGAGGIAAGTARWMGLTAAAVREAAGLSTAARPLLEADPAGPSPPDPCGPLVLLGGGPTPPEALWAAAELADSDGAAQVAWVGAAYPWAPETAETRRRQFDEAAPGTRVTDVGLNTRADAEHPHVTAALEQADVAFLEGGKCELLYRALAGTPALQALVACSERGGVVIGYSAGAQVLGTGFLTDWMSWGEYNEPHRLLGWLADTVIHPHASGRRELDRLRATLAVFPSCRGVGVAHGGAVKVPAGSPAPLGITTGWNEGCVTIADAGADPVPLGDAF